jgi:acetyltransferase-like isoleucine patch superfamily enzyme
VVTQRESTPPLSARPPIVRALAVPHARRSLVRSVYRLLVPEPLRRGAHQRLVQLRRWLKAPQMAWGYECPAAGWRPHTRMSDTVHVYRPERVQVGDHVFVGHYCVLDGTGGIEIGEGVHLAAWAGIFTHSSHTAIRLYGRHYNEVPEDEKVAYHVAPVRIGRYAYLGAGAKVLSGVTVGEGAVIGAGSIVLEDVAPFTVVVGNPARVAGDTRSLDAPYLDDPKLRAWYEEWQRSGEDGWE